ncbi:hypothetical protein P9199_16595 [Geobacillus stearothermophilus]|jgi:hypothetical protein|uniref:hypothetical protein n=1 Tax=Bacillales TaxID=1385 RepID=UPI001292685A|nr:MULTISPECIES: hypothetical protein [Bacillaceae]MED4271701.1 hypothetical protein [Geobacillus stearothermophilus]
MRISLSPVVINEITRLQDELKDLFPHINYSKEEIVEIAVLFFSERFENRKINYLQAFSNSK